jgi:hypothetical protein
MKSVSEGQHELRVELRERMTEIFEILSKQGKNRWEEGETSRGKDRETEGENSNNGERQPVITTRHVKLDFPGSTEMKTQPLGSVERSSSSDFKEPLRVKRQL